MTYYRSTWVAMSIAMGLSAGCNSAARASYEFSPEPLIRDARSDSGRYTVDWFTAPDQPPIAGTVAVKLRILEQANGEPKDGLTLHTTPVMPTMGHGTSTVPEADAEGDGFYLFPSVNLFMAGRWDFVTELEGETSDTLTVSLEVR